MKFQDFANTRAMDSCSAPVAGADDDDATRRRLTFLPPELGECAIADHMEAWQAVWRALAGPGSSELLPLLIPVTVGAYPARGNREAAYFVWSNQGPGAGAGVRVQLIRPRFPQFRPEMLAYLGVRPCAEQRPVVTKPPRERAPRNSRELLVGCAGHASGHAAEAMAAADSSLRSALAIAKDFTSQPPGQCCESFPGLVEHPGPSASVPPGAREAILEFRWVPFPRFNPRITHHACSRTNGRYSMPNI